MYTGTVMEAKEKLVADFGTVIEDTEQLLQATANQANEKVAAARAKVQESIKAAKQKIDSADAAARAKVQESIKAAKQRIDTVENAALGKAKAADDYLHEHPWRVVGAAAALGALVGMLIARR
jgi:ElaB/YqjD/DUF883 family membrane-anchored ribosome-binding protein